MTFSRVHLARLARLPCLVALSSLIVLCLPGTIEMPPRLFTRSSRPLAKHDERSLCDPVSSLVDIIPGEADGATGAMSAFARGYCDDRVGGVT